MSMDVSEFVSDFVEHHGTKGMKWGVRKNASRSDKKWAKNIYSINGAVAIHNNVADKMNGGELAKLNAAHPKAHLDHDTPATRAYISAYEKLTVKLTEQAIKEVHGTSPTGGYQATLGFKDGEHAIIVKATNVKHAGDFEWETLIIPLEDNGQYITAALKVQKTEMAQSNLVDDFLAHFGKKGMKWGVRKAKGQAKVSSDFKKTSDLRKKKPHELTNKQLKDVNQRINLEKNFKNLNPGKVEVGHATVKQILAFGGTAIAVHQILNHPSTKAGLAAVKHAIKTAKILKVVRP